MIGGMSRINRDVPPYVLIEGNPARVRSLNLVGLKRAGLANIEDGRVLRSLKQAFRLLYRSNLTLAEALEKLESHVDNEHIQHLQRFMQLSQAGHRGLTPGKRVGTSDDDDI